jgi:hypothetical protein
MDGQARVAEWIEPVSTDHSGVVAMAIGIGRIRRWSPAGWSITAAKTRVLLPFVWLLHESNKKIPLPEAAKRT